MNEDKFLDNLFESAREEAPRHSYNQTIQRFLAAPKASATWSWKKFLLSGIGKTIALAASAGTLSIVIWQGVKMQGEGQHLNYTSTQDSIVNILPEEMIDSDTIESISPLKEELNTISIPEEKVTHEITSTSAGKDSIKRINHIPKLKLEKIPEVKPPQVSKQDYDRSEPVNDGYIMRIDQTSKQVDLDRQIRILTDEEFKVTMRGTYSKNQDTLTYLLIHFKHKKGLDFKLSGRNFQSLELWVINDPLAITQSFAYRFNKEPFTKQIPLNCKGYRNHEYGDGFTGYTGKTNVNIDP